MGNQENKELQVIEQESNKVIAIAKSIEITSQEQLEQATEITKNIKEASKRVIDFWKPLKEQASKVHKDLCAKEKEKLDPLAEAEKILKGKMMVYVTKQERIARQKEEEARILKEKEAMRLLEEAEKLKAEGKEEEAVTTEAMAVMVDTTEVKFEPTISKVSGLSFKTVYKAVIKDLDKVPTTLNGIVIRPVDIGQVEKLFNASKGQLKIEGIEVIEEKISSIRR